MIRFWLWIQWHAYLLDHDRWRRRAIAERGHYQGRPVMTFRQWRIWREDIRWRRLEERARR